MSVCIPQQEEIQVFANDLGSISIVCALRDAIIVIHPGNVSALIQALKAAKIAALDL